MIKRIFLVMLSGAGAALICVMFGYFYLKHKLNKTYHIQQPVMIDIAPTSTCSDIANNLYSVGLIPRRSHFGFFTQVLGLDSSLKSGEFIVPAQYSIRSLIKLLAHGKNVSYKITFPEGITKNQIIRRLNGHPKLAGKIQVDIREGYLMPDTYYFTKGEDRNRILLQMQDRMEKTLQSIWQTRNANIPVRNKSQLLNIAAIIEKETSLDTERTHVAGVYSNRLRKRMHLNADPTVRYGLHLINGKPLNEALVKTEMRIDTPYNTYKHIGLPAGPICNPGVSSLHAAAHPLLTKDLYFVANGQGGHEFAPTLALHNKNRQKWRKIRHQLKLEQSKTG